MRNMFFYSRRVTNTSEDGINTITEYQDGMNLEMVIRSVTLPSGEVIILLNDLHEQIQQLPSVNEKTKKVTYKEVKTSVQSEITLSAEDGKRFFDITNVEHLYKAELIEVND